MYSLIKLCLSELVLALVCVCLIQHSPGHDTCVPRPLGCLLKAHCQDHQVLHTYQSSAIQDKAIQGSDQTNQTQVYTTRSIWMKDFTPNPHPDQFERTRTLFEF
ncbi:hypothetical protein RRG08_058744 [Elysia crispata]|uniref:Secreted protein n=1 Tax=Elysia crispata TaxID=231223 RepID=A0AAE1D5U4_9GAST|nr:hypothetical protein RRG08_058744 [Elysia crispata]